MAKATANCTCRKCGQSFVRINRQCRNRSDADNWTTWAENNITLCPECWSKGKRQEEEKQIAEMNLPEISGVSERQVSYAADLRRKALCSKYYKVYTELMEQLDQEILREEAEAQGKTEEEILMDALKYYGCEKVHIALTESSARRIIDSLK